MISDRRRLGLLALILLGLPPVAAAETTVELIARVKPSVVLVGSYGLLDSPRFGFSGTGFVVSDGRHVVTNAHVLPVLPPGRVDRRVAIQHWSADAGWSVREASVKRTDPLRDLALLVVDGPPLPPVKLASKDVAEGADIVLIGFPLGGALGFSHVSHRGMVASLTAIAPQAMNAQTLQPRALQQLRRGSFEVLQLDATAYPGNSGGPVFDLVNGEVVGVISMVLVKGTREAALSAPSGISYAVKARDVAALLAGEPKD
jgi:S1-C subfamily serine protease